MAIASGTSVGISRRVGTDPPAPVIVGLASCFYRADQPGTEYELWRDDDYRVVERIMPTAFDSCLAQGASLDCAGLFNHDPNCLLGRTTSGTMTLRKTSAGLEYTIAPSNTSVGRDVIASIERGDLRGSSFSFTVNDQGQRFVRTGKLVVREILSVERLYDVGPVTFPAYGSATTGMGRSRSAPRNRYDAIVRLREIEANL